MDIAFYLILLITHEPLLGSAIQEAVLLLLLLVVALRSTINLE